MVLRMLRRFSLFWACTASSLAAAAEVQAKKDIEIFTDATNKSEVIGKLAKGESLPAVERKGMFWQVKTSDGQTGFVSVLAVAHKADTNGKLAEAIKAVVKEGRSTDATAEVRARSAVMGVRGLRADDNAGNAGAVRPDIRAVYSLEDVRVPKKQLEALGTAVFEEISKKSEKTEAQ